MKYYVNRLKDGTIECMGKSFGDRGWQSVLEDERNDQLAMRNLVEAQKLGITPADALVLVRFKYGVER